VKNKKIPLSQALAVAFAVFEHNKNRVERDYIRADDDNAEVIPNRVNMVNYFVGQPVEFVVTKQHSESVEEAITYLQQVSMMQTLTNGKCDSFLGNVVDIIGNQETTIKEFGILAWVPKLLRDYQNKDRVREASSLYEYRSRHFGRIGEKIEIQFTLLESRFITNMGCYAVYGHTADGDLVRYWAKDQSKIVKQGQLSGRVKMHGTDSYHSNARVTNLNYVKVL
jgi:hypothetical protein